MLEYYWSPALLWLTKPLSSQTGLMIAVTASKSASTIAAIVSTIDWTSAVIASTHAWIVPLIVHLMPAGTMFQIVSIERVIASTAGWTIVVIE